MDNTRSQGLKIGDDVMCVIDDGYGDFERNKIYCISNVSDDSDRVKVAGSDLWWYSSRFAKIKDIIHLCLYPDLDIIKEEVLSFKCPVCKSKIFVEVTNDIDVICYYCSSEIY